VADNAARLAGVSNERIGQLGTRPMRSARCIEVIQDIASRQPSGPQAPSRRPRSGEAARALPWWRPRSRSWPSRRAEAPRTFASGYRGFNPPPERRSVDRARSAKSQERHEVSRTIAAAVEEQSVTTKEIARTLPDAVPRTTSPRAWAQSAAAGPGNHQEHRRRGYRRPADSAGAAQRRRQGPSFRVSRATARGSQPVKLEK